MKKDQMPGGESPNQFSGKPMSPSPMGKMNGHEDAKARKKATKND